MRTATANRASAADSGFRFKENCVEVRKILELQSGNFLADKMFDRLERGNFLAVHERERVADILGSAGPADTMDIIFRMLRHIVIDDVTDPGDIKPARGDVGRD